MTSLRIFDTMRGILMVFFRLQCVCIYFIESNWWLWFRTFITLCVWWLVRVTLVVAFGFLPHNFRWWQGPMNHSFVILWMQVHLWGYHDVVGTFKPYYGLKNLFEIIALKGDGDRKTLGMSTHAQVQGLTLVPIASAGAHEPPGETFTA